MLLRNIIDQFLDKNGLSDSGTSEKTDLSTFEIRLKKVNHLYSGKQNFL